MTSRLPSKRDLLLVGILVLVIGVFSFSPRSDGPFLASLDAQLGTLAAIHLTSGGSNTSQTSSYTTTSIAPSANKLILLSVISRKSSGPPAVPLVSGNGLTWIEVASRTSGANNTRLSVFRAMGTSPTSGLVTIDYQGVQQFWANWTMVEIDGVDISGADGTNAIVQAATSVGSGTTGSVTLAAFGSPENATYAVFGQGGANDYTSGSGFTQLGQNNTEGSIFSEFRSDNDTSVDASWATSRAWSGIGLEIKSAGGPPPPPTPTADIKANGSDGPITVPHNTSATVSWTSMEATSCSVSPTGWSGINGSQDTGMLTSSQTYTVNCDDPGGSVIDSVVINVEPPPSPTVDIKANDSDGPITIPYETSAVVSWTSSLVTSCSVSPSSWSGTSGSQFTGQLTSSQTYVVDCTGPDGTVTDSVVVNVQPPLSERPNIIFILTDDQRADTVQYMPNTLALLGEEGITFENAFHAQGLCCPARVSILTGLFPHNHLCFTNPCAQKVRDDELDQSTIATWLNDAGYWTGLIGKYLNGFEVVSPYPFTYPYIPPGWDVWEATAQEKVVGNDMSVFYTDRAIDFIRNVPAESPFFLYLAYHAPHQPAKSTSADYAQFADIEPWNPSSFNETDVSDKPPFVQNTPLLSADKQTEIQNFRKKQLASLQSVDRGVAQVVAELQNTGKLDNTIIIFASDNGWHWGEHRLQAKDVVYEEVVDMPLLMRIPGVSPRTESKFVSIVDLAPTIADYAEVIPITSVDGTSLRPLIDDPTTAWRSAVLLESNKHSGIRTTQYKYVEHTSGQKELYDLTADPYELESRHADPAYASIISQLKTELEILKTH